MIGVVADDAGRTVIREFFELFKTPWEFWRPGVAYDVLICSGSNFVNNSAGLSLVYGSGENATDAPAGITRSVRCQNTVISCQNDRVPIHGSYVTFAGPAKAVLRTEDGETIGLEILSSGSSLVRIGFDLFAEVELLLGQGQPARHARIPTLDLHISLLRHLIVSHSISLCEIPPVPAGYGFIVCLTHDVDHCKIKNHRWDHTAFGFLYRATVGSLFGWSTGRKSFAQVVANWKAAFSLPFVYLGWTRDFWKTFRSYLEMEDGSPSTFFVIPRRNDPGASTKGLAPSRRAAHYDLTEIGDELHALLSQGCEVGTHGIDAWRDASKGRFEREAIQTVTGKSEIGVRMHWLYFNEESPALLEKAGFSYDSTFGYNETVGYRAGTSQVFRPVGVSRLLELPMHVMDTALFFPVHMNLKPSGARVVLDEMLANSVRFGGVLTVNWHDRSVAPERLWDQTYRELLHELRDKRAWFATAGQAVSWFRKRRSARFETTGHNQINLAFDPSDDELPALELRRHNGVLAQSGPPSAVVPGATETPVSPSDPDCALRVSQRQVYETNEK